MALEGDQRGRGPITFPLPGQLVFSRPSRQSPHPELTAENWDQEGQGLLRCQRLAQDRKVELEGLQVSGRDEGHLELRNPPEVGGVEPVAAMDQTISFRSPGLGTSR